MSVNTRPVTADEIKGVLSLLDDVFMGHGNQNFVILDFIEIMLRCELERKQKKE